MNIFKIAILSTALAVTIPPLHAATLTIDAGLLTGAERVNVGGTFYDLSFVEGTFNDVFGTTPDFDATSYSEAVAFSQALFDQVFVGIYDDQPALTYGCSGTTAGCQASTPYELFSSNLVRRSGAQNTLPQHSSSQGLMSSLLITTDDSSDIDSQVWADWSVSADQTSVVPVPAAVWLFGSGLIGLAGFARRKKA